MPNPNSFIANSDYPFDMVAKTVSGSCVRGQPHGQSVSIEDYALIPHQLNFLPLVSGVWSLDPDFATSYPLGYLVTIDNQLYGIQQVLANDTNVALLPMGVIGTEYYYKVYCLVPGTLDTQIYTPALGGFKNFTFNSDLAYMKIFKEEILTFTTQKSTVTVEHNLGFVPFVRYWEEVPILKSGSSLDYITGYVGKDFYGDAVKVDEQKIEITHYNNYASQGEEKFYYRIYADET